jgi:hypothetical protein
MKIIDWILNLAAFDYLGAWFLFFSTPKRITLCLAAVVNPREKAHDAVFFLYSL